MNLKENLPKIENHDVKRKIGGGVFGNYYEVEHEGFKYALKIIKGTPENNIKAVKTLELLKETTGLEPSNLEARISDKISKLSHPNIASFKYVVPAHNIKLPDESFIATAGIVYEFIEGENLEEKIQRNIKEGRKFTGPKLYDIYRQILSGMEALHSVVLHKDIKCENIMINNEGLIKIVDFGLSSDTDLTGKIQGDRFCQAPETYNNAYDLRSEIWSLGIVLYKMVTGRFPFDLPEDKSRMKEVFENPETYKQIDKNIGKINNVFVRHILKKCLNKDPTKRYKSVSQLKNFVEETWQDYVAVQKFWEKNSRKVKIGLLGLGLISALGLGFLGAKEIKSRRDANKIYADYFENIKSYELLKGFVEQVPSFDTVYPNFLKDHPLQDTAEVRKEALDLYKFMKSISVIDKDGNYISTHRYELNSIDNPEVNIGVYNHINAPFKNTWIHGKKIVRVIYGKPYDINKTDEFFIFGLKFQKHGNKDSVLCLTETKKEGLPFKIYRNIVFNTVPDSGIKVTKVVPDTTFFSIFNPTGFSIRVENEYISRDYSDKFNNAEFDDGGTQLVTQIQYNNALEVTWIVDNKIITVEKPSRRSIVNIFGETHDFLASPAFQPNFDSLGTGKHKVSAIISNTKYKKRIDWDFIYSKEYSSVIKNIYPLRLFDTNEEDDVAGVGDTTKFSVETVKIPGVNFNYEWNINFLDKFENVIRKKTISRDKEAIFIPKKSDEGPCELELILNDGTHKITYNRKFAVTSICDVGNLKAFASQSFKNSRRLDFENNGPYIIKDLVLTKSYNTIGTVKQDTYHDIAPFTTYTLWFKTDDYNSPEIMEKLREHTERTGQKTHYVYVTFNPNRTFKERDYSNNKTLIDSVKIEDVK